MNVAPEQTTTRTSERELEDLLSETPAHATQRAHSRLRLSEGDALALYGAGHLGRQVLAGLRSRGLEPAAFVDDTLAKQGTRLDGLPVTSPREFAREHGVHALFAVTIFNPAASFLRIKRALQSQTEARVVSFLELAWKYSETLLPHYQFELPNQVLQKGERIRKGFRVFADEESQRQFVAHLRFRLHLSFDCLPTSNPGDYFPADVVADLPRETTFVDCGAFDGDTVRRFIRRQRGSFREIYAFEPDEDNFRRLDEYVKTLAAGVAQRIHLFRTAVGARRAHEPFNAGSGMASALNVTGSQQVDVMPLQEVIASGADLLFLKFDVEGGEAEALDGAAGLVSDSRTISAVCVYHRPDDLWELPLKLHSMAPSHKLFLRTQGEDGMDVVCYAVPDNFRVISNE